VVFETALNGEPLISVDSLVLLFRWPTNMHWIASMRWIKPGTSSDGAFSLTFLEQNISVRFTVVPDLLDRFYPTDDDTVFEQQYRSLQQFQRGSMSIVVQNARACPQRS
jgi:hypothetical protein